jgi:hypothetical protein
MMSSMLCFSSSCLLTIDCLFESTTIVDDVLIDLLCYCLEYNDGQTLSIIAQRADVFLCWTAGCERALSSTNSSIVSTVGKFDAEWYRTVQSYFFTYVHCCLLFTRIMFNNNIACHSRFQHRQFMPPIYCSTPKSSSSFKRHLPRLISQRRLQFTGNASFISYDDHKQRHMSIARMKIWLL